MQKQEQTDTALLTRVQQLGEAEHMGTFVGSYPRHYKAHPLGCAFLAVFCVGLMGLFVLAFLPLSYFLLALALLGFAVFLQQVWTETARRDDQVAVFAEGFIFLSRSKHQIYRWKDITYMLRGSAQSEGEGIGDIDILKIWTTQDRFKIDSSWEKHSRASICDRIERGFVFARLPLVMDQYKSGKEIAFSVSPNDFFGVSTSGFRNGQELLPWPMVEKAEIGPELVIIKKEGRTSDWYHKLICEVPSAALLKALLETLRSS